MSGPAKTPTALVIARGNPGKRPLPKAEPKPRACAPNPPADLDAFALAEWHRLVALLMKVRVLTENDGSALAQWCKSASRQRAAEKEFIADGSRYAIHNERTGGLSANPLTRIIQAEAKLQDRLMQQFGMTPSSRTRVQTVGGDQKESDPFDDLDAIRDGVQ